MAKYKAYPEYKYSGVEWLGMIPTEWKIPHFKWLTNDGKAFASGPFGSSIGSKFYQECGVPVIRGNNLSINGEKPLFKDSGYVYLDDAKANELSNAEVIAGDLVFTARGTVGQVGLIPTDGTLSWNRAILSANQLRYRTDLRKYNSNYLWYQFSSWFIRTQITLSSDSVAQPNLNLGSLKTLNIIVPPLMVQKAIADFLDHETAKIDNLIEKQQQLIELLKEKRQAVISHAVTKGLNPDVPMKDSGVEWLRNIPEHWEQSRIGWICNVGNGCTPSRENTLYWQNGSYPWLNSSKVNDERILTAEQFVTTKALYECSLPIVKKGSVIIAITGEGKTRGTSALMMINATINQHVAYITPRAKDRILPEFIHLWLQSKYQKIRTSSEGWGSTKAAITCSDVKCYPIPMPPLKEQIEIVSAIEDKKAIFTSLLLNCEQQIEILQERRTALISAAVTGKIDVRDWVAPDTQDVEEPQEATA